MCSMGVLNIYKSDFYQVLTFMFKIKIIKRCKFVIVNPSYLLSILLILLFLDILLLTSM